MQAAGPQGFARRTLISRSLSSLSSIEELTGTVDFRCGYQARLSDFCILLATRRMVDKVLVMRAMICGSLVDVGGEQFLKSVARKGIFRLRSYSVPQLSYVYQK